MIIADLEALRASMNASDLSGESLALVNDMIEDLIGASVAQDAYQKARPLLKTLNTVDHREFDYLPVSLCHCLS